MSALSGLPRLRIEVDGQPLSADALARLTALRVQQRLSLPAQLELVATDPGEQLPEELRAGAALRVCLEAPSEVLFDGELTGVEYRYGADGIFELRARGYDVLHRLRKQQQTRAHVQLTGVEFARELAGSLGLSLATDERLQAPLWPHWIQYDQSDFQLLGELCARAGLYFQAAPEALNLMTLAGTGADVPLHRGENLIEVAVDATAEFGRGGVGASGWDHRGHLVHDGNAGAARTPAGAEGPIDYELLGAQDERHLADILAPDADHARAAAQAERDRRAAAGRVVRGVAMGDPRLRPGARVRLHGVHDSMGGQYVLAEAEHVIDVLQGYVTRFSSEPPAAHPERRAARFTLGEITRVDPDSGRVKASLPSFADLETDWMQVVCPGAGANKGLAVLPDVGDHVALLHCTDNPAASIVLGGLYGEAGPMDAGVSAGRVRRFILRTAAGHRLELDDEQRSITLTDVTGSSVQLTPSRVTLRSAVPLNIEAPGQALTFIAESVDFWRR